MDLVEMTLDVMKYTIDRISNVTPELGSPRKEEELLRIVGETITPEGIGGENAFQLFRDVLVKATVPIDHPRHLAFVPAAPTRAAIMFDLVTSASSIHGAYWMEGAGGILREPGHEMAGLLNRIATNGFWRFHQRRYGSKPVGFGDGAGRMALTKPKISERTCTLVNIQWRAQFD